MGSDYISLADHPLGIYEIDLFDRQENRIGVLHYPHSTNQLIDPILSRGVNRAGSLKFDICRTHPFYDALQYLQCYARVYRDDACIFECRPASINEKDGIKSIACEGALAYLNDSVQWRQTYKGYTPSQYLTAKIDWHNARVDDAMRRFGVNCTITGDLGDIEDNDLPKTLENLQNKLVSRFGGYLDIEYTIIAESLGKTSNTLKDIVYHPDLPKLEGQRVQAAVNLLSYEKGLDISEMFTVLIPTGATDQSTGLPLTIQTVSDGHTFVECSDAIATYGRIWGTHNWPDISDPGELKTVAQAYVDGLFNQPWSITISAADLYYSGGSKVPLQYGTKIFIENSKDGISGWFDCTDEEIHIADPAKNKYTIGGKRPTISGIGVWQQTFR